MEQLNHLRQFRQAVYHNSFTKRRNAQQELLDSLLLSPPVRSFPQLTLSSFDANGTAPTPRSTKENSIQTGSECT